MEHRVFPLCRFNDAEYRSVLGIIIFGNTRQTYALFAVVVVVSVFFAAPGFLAGVDKQWQRSIKTTLRAKCRRLSVC